MRWDHLPGFEKAGDISGGFPGRTEREILDEIAKCELVCTNCHIIRTFKRKGSHERYLREPEATYGDVSTRIAA